MAVSTQTRWRLTWQTWLSLLALGLALWFTINHARLIAEIAGALFGAFLFSLAMGPLADVLARRRVPRGLVVLGFYVALAAMLALLGYLLVSLVSADMAELRAHGPTLLKKAFSQVASIPLLGGLLPSSDSLAQDLAQRLDTVVRAVVNAVAGLGGFILDLVIALILAYFFTASPRLGSSALRQWLPRHHEPRARALLQRVRHRLSRWMWAQAALAVYLGLAFGLGLTLLKVPFALTIGLTGAILEMAPYLGAVTALILGLVSALTVRPLLALWVVVLYVVIIEVEYHILAPALYGRATGLHPAVVLVVLVVGLKAAGLIGVFFAVPVAVTLMAFAEEVQAPPPGSAPELAGSQPEAQENAPPSKDRIYNW